MKAANHACSVFLRAILLRMKELRLNHTSLAARMKVSRPYVAKVLAGDVNISFGTALKFAKALQMDFLPVLTPKAAKVSANVASSGGSCLPSRVFAGAKANRTDRNSAYAEGFCGSTRS